MTAKEINQEQVRVLKSLRRMFEDMEQDSYTSHEIMNIIDDVARGKIDIDKYLTE